MAGLDTSLTGKKEWPGNESSGQIHRCDVHVAWRQRGSHFSPRAPDSCLKAERGWGKGLKCSGMKAMTWVLGSDVSASLGC